MVERMPDTTEETTMTSDNTAFTVFAVYAEDGSGEGPAEIVGLFTTEQAAQDYADQYPEDAGASVAPYPVCVAAPRRVVNYMTSLIFTPGQEVHVMSTARPLADSEPSITLWADEGEEGPGWVYEPATVKSDQPTARGMHVVSVAGTDAKAVHALLLATARERGYLGE